MTFPAFSAALCKKNPNTSVSEGLSLFVAEMPHAMPGHILRLPQAVSPSTATS